jgi:hypothetical protein
VSSRRITVALVGLVLLAVIGWLATDLTSHRADDGHPARQAPVTSVSVSRSAPTPAGASG